MTTTQQLAAQLVSQGMGRDEIVHFIYGCQSYASLAEIYEAIDQAQPA
jgi:hypothetical protein